MLQTRRETSHFELGFSAWFDMVVFKYIVACEAKFIERYIIVSLAFAGDGCCGFPCWGMIIFYLG
jgi:hypothetical protein